MKNKILFVLGLFLLTVTITTIKSNSLLMQNDITLENILALNVANAEGDKVTCNTHYNEDCVKVNGVMIKGRKTITSS